VPILPVTSLDDPRLAPYANMRDAELAQRLDPLDPAAHGGLFIAEGDLVLRRLIDSPFPTDSVLLAENRVDTLAPELARLSAHVPVFVAPQALFNAIVGFNMHRGVLAIGRRVQPYALEDLLGRSGPILILEDLVNHDNLGGIFRNAAGLGGTGCSILLSPRCGDPLYRKSLRVSMGHVLSVPFRRLTDWPGDLARIVAAGWDLLALTPRPDAIDLEDLAGSPRRSPSYPESAPRRAVLLGSEGPGLTESALAAAPRAVRIAMPPSPGGQTIDSLNVAMAAGIALYRLGPR
jgi:tRNA G18 (ribose-2'-O)-methylase SpoU